MGNPYFRFRQFTVWHDRCAMKVGTDGVLLGAWAGQGRPGKILDIGTGSGLIALMLAQRFPEARITGIEPDAEAAAQAGENFLCSPWRDRLAVREATIQDFTAGTAGKETFDLIVSNPPFYDSTLLNPDARRSAARHTATLPYSELMRCASALMTGTSELDIIIPSEYWRQILQAAGDNGLAPQRLVRINSTPRSGIRRLLVSFGKNAEPPAHKESLTTEEVLLTDADGSRSEWYRGLAAEFYLN